MCVVSMSMCVVCMCCVCIAYECCVCCVYVLCVYCVLCIVYSQVSVCSAESISSPISHLRRSGVSKWTLTYVNLHTHTHTHTRSLIIKARWFLQLFCATLLHTSQFSVIYLNKTWNWNRNSRVWISVSEHFISKDNEQKKIFSWM